MDMPKEKFLPASDHGKAILAFLENYNEGNQTSERFYGFREHWQAMSSVLGKYCYDLILLIQCISKGGADFSASYRSSVENWSGPTGGVSFDQNVASEDQIIQWLLKFLDDYEPPNEPVKLRDDLLSLNYIIDFFRNNNFKYLPYMVQIKIDLAACKLIGQTAGVSCSGVTFGMKKEGDFRKGSAAKKTRQQLKVQIVSPTVKEELEKYLQETSKDTLENLYENKVLQILEGRLEKILGKNGGGSVNTIRPIVRELFRKKGYPPPWKRRKNKRKT